MPKNNLSLIILGLTLLALGFLVKNSFESYWQKKAEIEVKKLLIEAVADCGKVTSVTWTNPKDGSQVSEPFLPAYEKCLKDKGY